jgi:hypothetical protein
MTNEKMQKLMAPAFPPQVFKDNFDRFVSVIPGMSKLEFASAMILPFYLQRAARTKLMHNGKEVSPIQAAIITATDLFNEIDTVCTPSPIV